jgi:cation-transporting ATPase 13A2
MRRFDFNSQVMRMSVITMNLQNNHVTAFVKGSPEKIKELSIPTSIPKDFDRELEQYTSQGL